MTGFKSKKAAAQDKLDSMEREALKLALEVLENGDVPTPENVGKNLDAITAIKAVLAQPEQRPWVDLTENEIEVIEVMALTKAWAIRMAMAHLKERNT